MQVPRGAHLVQRSLPANSSNSDVSAKFFPSFYLCFSNSMLVTNAKNVLSIQQYSNGPTVSNDICENTNLPIILVETLTFVDSPQ